jgi:hypothetical protein
MALLNLSKQVHFCLTQGPSSFKTKLCVHELNCGAPRKSKVCCNDDQISKKHPQEMSAGTWFFWKRRLKTLEFPSPEKEHQALQIVFSFGLPGPDFGSFKSPSSVTPSPHPKQGERALLELVLLKGRHAAGQSTAHNACKCKTKIRQTAFYTTWQPDIGQDGIAQ